MERYKCKVSIEAPCEGGFKRFAAGEVYGAHEISGTPEPAYFEKYNEPPVVLERAAEEVE